MLQHIVSLVTALINILYYLLVLSINAGKLLFCLLVVFKDALALVCDKISTFLVVFYEDYGIFFNDIKSTVSYTVNAMLGIIEIGVKSTLRFCELLGRLFIAGEDNITNFSGFLVNIIETFFVNLKLLLILIGNGVWFLLTLLPNFLYFIGQVVLIDLPNRIYDYVTVVSPVAIDFTKQFFNNILNYFTDFPLQAIVGIYTLYLGCMKFHIIKPAFIVIGRQCKILIIKLCRYIYGYLRRKFRMWFIRSQRPNNQFNNSMPRTPQQCHDIDESSKKHSRQNRSPKDGNLCIVCADREKCVLLIPCKHLCVCTQCADQINQIQKKCPICRVYINQTIRVYL